MIEPRFLLDANICVYILDGTIPMLLERLGNCEQGELATSAIAFAEVMIGAERKGAAAQARRLFRAVAVLPFDPNAAIAYSHLPFKRGSFDRLIAAHALSLDLTLVTANESDFSDIPGLRVENWIQ